jgi:hypothetical protein
LQRARGRWRITVKVGVARVPITPPVGAVHLRGFASRFQPCPSIHDPLWTTAVVLADEAAPRAALIACDVCAIGPADAPRFEQQVAAVGVPREAVWLACSHTHSGPGVGLPPADAAPADAEQRYSLWLMDQIAAAAFLASRELRPAAAGAAVGETRIGINRRQRRADGAVILGENPDGPVDHRAMVVRIEDAEGRPLAALLHHACRPVVMGPDSYAVPADYVGAARAGVVALDDEAVPVDPITSTALGLRGGIALPPARPLRGGAARTYRGAGAAGASALRTAGATLVPNSSIERMTWACASGPTLNCTRKRSCLKISCWKRIFSTTCSGLPTKLAPRRVLSRT